MQALFNQPEIAILKLNSNLFIGFFIVTFWQNNIALFICANNKAIPTYLEILVIS